MATREPPRPSQFIVDEPLYRPLPYDGEEVWQILDIIYYTGSYDAICLECKKIATFQAISPPRPPEFKRNMQREALERREGLTVNPPTIPTGLHVLSGQCTRDTYHDPQKFIFWTGYRRVRTADNKVLPETFIEKIGQHPSFADMLLPAVRDYRPILGPERMSEFNKAIGLAAHGVGVGSYVYLRRIFETLIDDAYAVAVKVTEWDDDAYRNDRMSERINLLKNHLPEFLVKNSDIYSLLSKGIHELTENECLEYFDTLRVGIELMLDARLEAMERDRKMQEASAALSRALNAQQP